jgi:Holliday junction resolvase RusA-like endonuclease
MTTPRKPVEAVMLDLPRPISVNRLWRTTKGGGWYPSPAYKQWKEEVGLIANANRVGCVHGTFGVTIRVKASWRGDIDNIAKATLDVFQSLGLIENDRLAQKIVIERCPNTEGMSVLVCSTEKRG